MDTSGMQIGVVHNRKDRLNSKLQKLEKEIKDSIHVSCRENLNEYLYNSTLHGPRYVGDRTISRFERTFFACMFFLVVALSIYFISIIWIKWTEAPMIITLSPTALSVTQLPFPAVTVCSMNQVLKSAMRNFSIDSPEYAVAKGLCKPDSEIGTNNSNVKTSDTWPVYNKVSNQVAPNCKDMLLFCEYGAIEFNCMERFKTILTDDGLCCIFNGVHRRFLNNFVTKYPPNPSGIKFKPKEQLPNLIPHRWTPEYGFQPKGAENNMSGYPLPGYGPGNELGLTMYLKTDTEDYFCSSSNSYGFKMVLHSPNDPPRVSNFGTIIPNGYETRIVIMPTLSEAAENVRQLPKKIRQCIFENENFLDFYHTYSEKNCESECETKALMEHCNCIMFYMPRHLPNHTICGHAHYECVDRVNRELQLRRNESFKCTRCLPGCYAIQYDNSFSMAKIFNRTPYLLKHNLRPNNVAFVHTYYGRSSFRSQRKNELVGFTDFLSNMGGLFGLFMGFSFISVIEMFYFISIRPYCSYIRLKKRRKELMAQLIAKVDNMRMKRDSPITISTVDTDMNFENSLPRPYLD